MRLSYYLDVLYYEGYGYIGAREKSFIDYLDTSKEGYYL